MESLFFISSLNNNIMKIKFFSLFAICTISSFLILGLSSCEDDTDTTETCSDGIQNQDETGVDCGGVCDACVPAGTCSDGILNQDEIGIDCGGVCDPCGPPSSGYYIYAEIDGVPTTFASSNIGYLSNTCGNDWFNNGGRLIESSTIIALMVFITENDGSSWQTNYDEMNIGSHSFGSCINGDGVAGASVVIRDEDDIIFATDLGNQSGSSFMLTYKSPYSGGAQPYINIEATFTCKFYSETGEVKTATNGQLRMPMTID